MTYNPHAIYVYCDGAMDYDSKSSGGIGYEIIFPETVDLENIHESIGRYEGANIERLEYEGIIQGMEATLKLIQSHKEKLRNVNQIIFVTDRYALHDGERTNPYKIKQWRSNKWHNHEGKPIKNSDLLDKLDKTRKKICDLLFCRLEINYKPRKFNKVANKLAKIGKTNPIPKDTISIKGTKPSKRLFNGNSIDYKLLHEKEEYIIRIYRKEPVRELWEIFAEICEGKFLGRKLKIYANDALATKLQRQHKYKIKIKSVLRFYINIYKTVHDIVVK